MHFCFQQRDIDIPISTSVQDTCSHTTVASDDSPQQALHGGDGHAIIPSVSLSCLKVEAELFANFNSEVPAAIGSYQQQNNPPDYLPLKIPQPVFLI